jgi:uncharacterized protein YcfJ
MRNLTQSLTAAVVLAIASPMAMAQSYYDPGSYSNGYSNSYNGSSYGYVQPEVGTVVGVWPIGSRGTQIENVCQAVSRYDNGNRRDSYVYDQYGNRVAVSYRQAGYQGYNQNQGYGYDSNGYNNGYANNGYQGYDGQNYDGQYDRNGQPKDPNRVAGKLLGALVGGALGNQIGHGNGRTATTIVGAVAGGYIGNKIERNGQRRKYGQNYNGNYDYANGSLLRCHNEVKPLGALVGYTVHYTVDGQTYSGRFNQAPRVGSRIRAEGDAQPID